MNNPAINISKKPGESTRLESRLTPLAEAEHHDDGGRLLFHMVDVGFMLAFGWSPTLCGRRMSKDERYVPGKAYSPGSHEMCPMCMLEYGKLSDDGSEASA